MELVKHTGKPRDCFGLLIFDVHKSKNSAVLQMERMKIFKFSGMLCHC
jgi:hypothetical protein